MGGCLLSDAVSSANWLQRACSPPARAWGRRASAPRSDLPPIGYRRTLCFLRLCLTSVRAVFSSLSEVPCRACAPCTDFSAPGASSNALASPSPSGRSDAIGWLRSGTKCPAKPMGNGFHHTQSDDLVSTKAGGWPPDGAQYRAPHSTLVSGAGPPARRRS